MLRVAYGYPCRQRRMCKVELDGRLGESSQRLVRQVNRTGLVRQPHIDQKRHTHRGRRGCGRQHGIVGTSSTRLVARRTLCLEAWATVATTDVPCRMYRAAVHRRGLVRNQVSGCTVQEPAIKCKVLAHLGPADERACHLARQWTPIVRARNRIHNNRGSSHRSIAGQVGHRAEVRKDVEPVRVHGIFVLIPVEAHRSAKVIVWTSHLHPPLCARRCSVHGRSGLRHMVVEYLHGHVFQGASRSFAGADPKGFGTEHGFTVAEYTVHGMCVDIGHCVVKCPGCVVEVCVPRRNQAPVLIDIDCNMDLHDLTSRLYVFSLEDCDRH
eukprot:m.228081 g.228081  ORF g.228081 m.228081 type:complete len:325 (+) comp37455_c0_seq1:162-1136(+)